MTKPGVIYHVACSANERVYVGSTTKATPRQRWLEHLHRLRKGDHHSPLLQRAWDKYGEAAFSFAVVETVDDGAQLLVREQFHVDLNGARLLNGSRMVSEGHLAANEATRGRRQPDDERARRSESAKRAYAEGRNPAARPWSDERKAEHSKRLRGRRMPPVSESTRQAISLAKRGTKRTPESVAKQQATRMRALQERLPACRELRGQGFSLRAIERATGVSRDVLARELGS